MARIRIKCRGPEPVQIGQVEGFPVLNGICPSHQDVEVYAVLDDGTEELIPEVESVVWASRCGDSYCRARLTLISPEVDVEGETTG